MLRYALIFVAKSCVLHAIASDAHCYGIHYVCFAQDAALRRGGRALSEKRKGHEGVDGDVFQV